MTPHDPVAPRSDRATPRSDRETPRSEAAERAVPQAGTSQPGHSPGPGRDTVGWVLGLVVYVVEVVVVGFISLLFGGLSVMLSDSCFRESTELICEARWQSALAATPITALVLTVIVVSVVMARARQYWSLVLAMAATPLVPLVAFMIMQEVVTA